MSKINDLVASMAEKRKEFYSWTPDKADMDATFRCYHQPMLHLCSESVCRARAENPAMYGEGMGTKNCGTHGRVKCPRWVYYRKQIKQKKKEEAKKLKEVL